MKTCRRGALAGLLGLFVLSQLAMAVLAVSGAHHHAWDTDAHGGVCWVCLAISLSAIAAVAGSVLAFREEAAQA